MINSKNHPIKQISFNSPIRKILHILSQEYPSKTSEVFTLPSRTKEIEKQAQPNEKGMRTIYKNNSPTPRITG